LGKAIFEFGDDGLSKLLEFNVYLQNKGDKKSESLTLFMLMFNTKVEASLKSHGLWVEDKKEMNFKKFFY